MNLYDRKFYTLVQDPASGEVTGAVFDHVDDMALRDYVREAIERFAGVKIVNCSGTWWGYDKVIGAWVQGRYLERAVTWYLRGVDVKNVKTQKDGTLKMWNVPLDVSRGRVKAVEQMLESGQTDDDFFNSKKPGVGHGVAFSGVNGSRSQAVLAVVQNRKSYLTPCWPSPEWRLRNFVRGDYDPNAQTPLFDKFLEDVFLGAPDKDERIRVIWEWLGIALAGYATSLAQALILKGPAGCGKSKLSQIIAACWPDTLRSAVSPHQLAEDRFSGSLLKAINTVGEIPSGTLDVAEKWKEVVAGDVISVERKYRDAYSARPYAAWVMACNTLPAVLDPSDGFTRRVLLVPMQRKFTDTAADDSNVANTIIANEIPQIVSRALNMCLPALAANRIKGCPSGDEILKEWRIGDNAILAWLNSPDVTVNAGMPSKASDLFAHFKKFCLDTGSEPGAAKKFSSRLRDQGFEPKRRKSGVYYDIQLPTTRPLANADDLDEAPPMIAAGPAEEEIVPMDDQALNKALVGMLQALANK